MRYILRSYNTKKTLTHLVKKLSVQNQRLLQSFSKIICCDAMDEVKEGKASVIFPKTVFYNPVQEFNRDITIAVISQFVKDKRAKDQLSLNKNKGQNKSAVKCSDSDDSITDSKGTEKESEVTVEGDLDTGQKEELQSGKIYEDGIRILEGLAASGLRSMRFGLEIPGVKEIIANDFDESAVKIIQRNIEKNALEGLVKANFGDAAMVMYQNRGQKDKFDVIDLDPYGSPHLFLDAAVQAVNEGGLLCITCTDAAVLCGKSPDTCYAKYGSVPLKGKYQHEMALRIILQCLESHANRYSRYIEPLLCVSIDFYFRVFVRVFTGQGKVKRSVSKMAMIYHCNGCGAFSQQKLGVLIPKRENNAVYGHASGPPVDNKCEHCGHTHYIGGPLWAEPMYDTDFIGRVMKHVLDNKEKLRLADRILGLCTMMREELQDQPLFYVMDDLCSVLHCNPPPSKVMRSAVLNAGYRVSMSHCAKNSIKTDAPPGVIWDILREWVKTNPVTEKRLQEGSVAKVILSKEPTTKISFEKHPEANPPSREKNLVRFPPNPEKHWGPKSRAKRGLTDKVEETEDKPAKRQAVERGDGNRDVPCKHFIAKGFCNYGSECLFQHPK